MVKVGNSAITAQVAIIMALKHGKSITNAINSKSVNNPFISVVSTIALETLSEAKTANLMVVNLIQVRALSKVVTGNKAMMVTGIAITVP